MIEVAFKKIHTSIIIIAMLFLVLSVIGICLDNGMTHFFALGIILSTICFCSELISFANSRGDIHDKS